MKHYNELYGNNCVNSVDLRTIGRCDSPLIVDRSPPVAGIVNDGEIHGVDLDFTKYQDKVLWLLEERLSRYHILEIEMESFRIQSGSLWVVLYRSVSQRLDTFFFEETKYYYVKFFSILWYIQIWYKQLISGFLIIIEKNPDLKIQLSFKPSSLSLYSCAVIGEVILFISYFMEADERRIYHFQFMIKGFIIFILW